MTDILDFNLNELKERFKEDGIKPFRAQQVFSWLKNGVFSFSDMKNLGSETQEILNEKYVVGVPGTVQLLQSKDGTKKALLELNDGNIIEAVLMKYEHGYSVCISTQVGCSMGCSFCASTREGLIRNLTPGEMLGEVLAMGKIAGERISNVVLMGAGEPLDNFDNVSKFLSLINSDEILGIGQRHITLSTCGLADRIRDFADLDTQVTLAVSLHETTDEKRKKLMPVAWKYSLKELFSSLEYYQEKTGRRITFEYALVKGINDTREDAVRLKNLLHGIKSHVNLIPVNDTGNVLITRPDPKSVESFREFLSSMGLEVTVRREMGSDISAACGQLKRSYISENAEVPHGGKDQ